MKKRKYRNTCAAVGYLKKDLDIRSWLPNTAQKQHASQSTLFAFYITARYTGHHLRAKYQIECCHLLPQIKKKKVISHSQLKKWYQEIQTSHRATTSSDRQCRPKSSTWHSIWKIGLGRCKESNNIKAQTPVKQKIIYDQHWHGFNPLRTEHCIGIESTSPMTSGGPFATDEQQGHSEGRLLWQQWAKPLKGAKELANSPLHKVSFW